MVGPRSGEPIAIVADGSETQLRVSANLPAPRAPHGGQSAPARPDNIPLGIACMIGATLMFAVSAAVMKVEVARYPVGEVVAGRSLCSLAISLAAVLPVTGLRVFATHRPGAHVARGLSQATSQTFTVIALWFMPLAGAIAIGFSAPLFAAILSILWLKEKADAARIAALGAGFVGVIVVTRPGADSMQIGALFALMNAAMYGSVTVAVRGMTKTESTLTLLMWQMAVVAICHGALLAFGCRLPAARDAGLLFGSGLSNVLAQSLWTKSLRLGPATAVSPFYYFLLVWALAIGFVVWGDRPAPSLVIGSIIVVGSGLALLARETRNTGATPAPASSLVEKPR